MATLYVCEYPQMAIDSLGKPMSMGMELPAGGGNIEQTIAIGGTSQQSVPFDSNSRIIRVHTDANCSVAVGLNPTATASKRRMAANSTEFFNVKAGWKIAVLQNDTGPAAATSPGTGTTPGTGTGTGTGTGSTTYPTPQLQQANKIVVGSWGQSLENRKFTTGEPYPQRVMVVAGPWVRAALGFTGSSSFNAYSSGSYVHDGSSSTATDWTTLFDNFAYVGSALIGDYNGAGTVPPNSTNFWLNRFGGNGTYQHNNASQTTISITAGQTAATIPASMVSYYPAGTPIDAPGLPVATYVNSIDGNGNIVLNQAATATSSAATLYVVTGGTGYPADDQAMSPGPRFRAALAGAAARRPDVIRFHQGTTDISSINGNAANASVYEWGLNFLIDTTRAQPGMANIPFDLVIIGRDNSALDGGTQTMRQIQLNVISYKKYVYSLALQYEVEYAFTSGVQVASIAANATTITLPSAPSGNFKTGYQLGTIGSGGIENTIFADGTYIQSISGNVITLSQATVNSSAVSNKYVYPKDNVHGWPSVDGYVKDSYTDPHTQGSFKEMKRWADNITRLFSQAPVNGAGFIVGPSISSIDAVASGDTTLKLNVLQDKGSALTALNMAATGYLFPVSVTPNGASSATTYTPTNVAYNSSTQKLTLTLPYTFASGDKVVVTPVSGAWNKRGLSNFITDNATVPMPLQPGWSTVNSALAGTVTGGAAAVSNHDSDMSSVLSSAVFDNDFTITGSYGGNGTVLKNIVPTPADGSAKAAYNFNINGSAPFTGTVDDPGAYLAMDGATYLQLVGANTALLAGMHKTSGGAPVTLAIALRTAGVATQQVLFSTSSATTDHGVFSNIASNGKLGNVQDNGSGATTYNANAALVASTDYLLVMTYDGANTAMKLYVNSKTPVAASGTGFATDSTDASYALEVGGRGNSGSNKLLSGARLYGVYGFNAALTDAQVTTMVNFLNTRHGRTYA